MSTLRRLTPYFDSYAFIDIASPDVLKKINRHLNNGLDSVVELYEHACDYLDLHAGHKNNYNTYRSEITCFLCWSLDVEERAIESFKRKDIHRYIDYCQSPPADEVGYFNCSQFNTDKETGFRVFNSAWRAFRGVKGKKYELSHAALKTKVGIISAFYTYLMEEGFTLTNPALTVLKHNRLKNSNADDFIQYDTEKMKSFAKEQFSDVIKAAKQLADEDPKHERELFMISLLYSCYLRISEISGRKSFNPTMGLFRKDDSTGEWIYFVPRSKGGKSRAIPVSDALLDALKRYRLSMGLSELPKLKEDTPLFPRQYGKKENCKEAVSANLGIRQTRKVIMDVFELAALNAREDGREHDAECILNQCVHSLRHTGISDDINVNNRTLNHVREDAGHGSFTTTSAYSHASRKERYISAKSKTIG